MHTRRQLLSASLLAPLAAQPARPNIIVLMTDDQGAHDLGCYGAGDLKTPHIDALAASGARFTNWYSNAPLCAPSRASLFTGRYPARAGVATNGPALAPTQKSLASLLQPLGYQTALTGKWHLGSDRETNPNAHGFSYFYGFHSGCVDFYSHRYYWGETPRTRIPNYHDLYRNTEEIFEDGEYLTERIAEEACGFIRRNAHQPFLLCATFNAPHYPMHAPRKYMERFPNLEPERRTYAAMMAAVDDGVGDIRRTLRQHNLLENTLIFFAADNGATTEPRAGLNRQPATAGDNSPYRGFKFSLFDGGMHVPAIMSWPGRIAAGQTITELAMTMDITPTALAAAGGTPPSPDWFDGYNLIPMVTGKAKSPHNALFWAWGGQSAIRKGKWKLVVNGATYGRAEGDNKPLAGEDALFLSDLEADPGETTNLRRRHPEILDELASMLEKWKRETGSK